MMSLGVNQAQQDSSSCCRTWREGGYRPPRKRGDSGAGRRTAGWSVTLVGGWQLAGNAGRYGGKPEFGEPTGQLARAGKGKNWPTAE